MVGLLGGGHRSGWVGFWLRFCGGFFFFFFLGWLGVEVVVGGGGCGRS